MCATVDSQCLDYLGYITLKIVLKCCFICSYFVPPLPGWLIWSCLKQRTSSFDTFVRHSAGKSFWQKFQSFQQITHCKTKPCKAYRELPVSQFSQGKNCFHCNTVHFSFAVDIAEQDFGWIIEFISNRFSGWLAHESTLCPKRSSWLKKSKDWHSWRVARQIS